ncbi:MAG: hypothetical protein RLZZ500_2428 [Bacteroidota bacterium]|jgi:hypothetical protein
MKNGRFLVYFNRKTSRFIYKKTGQLPTTTLKSSWQCPVLTKTYLKYRYGVMSLAYNSRKRFAVELSVKKA